ncbi:uncharacterized protein LOC111285712 [Durio zibethinus]|uniref:Uncharacterized protein LOC111285712 n=1 Tax=Durio zibethinus TaxID=66656 RepID=A0A6P5XS46_DURZI|nr:uncharacterized protein LOC111285712 [Durio zibethinus]
MKDRGKTVEVYSDNFFKDYSTSSDLPCKKHPQSSSVGICAYCLKDRLVKLVCSDCGEQRLSSCSCSEISSNPRTSCTIEVGSVGRVSFLIENENKDHVLNPSSKPKSNSSEDKSEEVFFLKRSNSSCVEIKRKNGFWRIGRLFRKKRDKDNCGKSVGGIDEKSDMWVVDYMGVSRSRSLCSFRGGGVFGSEDGGDLMNFSGARSSISAARSSSANGGLCFDPERKSGFSEAEPRKSGLESFDSDRRDGTFVESDIADIKATRKGGCLLDLDTGFSTASRRVFSLKESYFTGGDDSGFIDLKFDFQSESKGDIPSLKKGVLSDPRSFFGSMRGGDFVPHESGGSIQNALVGDGAFSNGGSCRITVNERGIKKSRKSFIGWRWIFKHHPNWSSTRKKDGDPMVNH